MSRDKIGKKNKSRGKIKKKKLVDDLLFIGEKSEKEMVTKMVIN